MDPDLTKAIASIPLLQTLPAEVRDFLLANATLQSYEAGKFLFEGGEPADQFFAVLSGRIYLEVGAQTGPATLAVIDAGGLVGWSWLVPPHEWRCDALAYSPVETIAFAAVPVRQRCETDPAFGYHMRGIVNQILAHRLGIARAKLMRFHS